MSPMRWCICQGCPACTPTGCRQLYDRDTTSTQRCPPCQAQADSRARDRRNLAPRAPTAARGYDAAHKRQRQRWAPIVAAGQARCAQPVCLEELDGKGRRINPGTPWDLAHRPDRTGWLGPAHARCNRARRRSP